jgi:hypothetical protein
VEFVLVRLNIILQEDLDLVVHFWPNVFQEKGCDDGHSAKPNGSQCNRPVIILSARHVAKDDFRL